MKHNKRLLIFLVALSVLACKDKTPTYYVDKEMLRYCWFPEGSYWIYEEANTPGLLDSVYASDVTRRINQEPEEDYKYEGFGMTLVVESKKRRQSTLAWPGEQESETLSELTEFYSDAGGQQVDYLFFSHTRGLDTLTSYPTTIICNRLDTVNIHGKTYKDAIEVCIDPPSVADWTYNVIWAKDVGIIRWSMHNGTIWELVRYRIN